MATYIQATPPGANTEDIIQALARAVPAAVEQIKPLVNKSGQSKDEPLKAALYFGNLVKKITKYKKDGLDTQLIVLPRRMPGNMADCKSFALFNVAAMAALGIPAGLRFASYRKNRIPTHVYNYIVINGKKFGYDSTLPNLHESKKFSYLRDMKVAYLHGVPTMVEDTSLISSAYIGKKRREKKQQRKEQRKQRREERRAAGKGFGQKLKKVSLAPARGAFLGLVRLNFRGIASKLVRLNNKNPKRLKDFWLKLGGDFNKLIAAASDGNRKAPLFGSKGVGAYTNNDFIGDYLGEPATAASLIVAAGSVLLAIQKLFKSEGKEFTDDTLAPMDAQPIDVDGTGFVAADPETQEAAQFAERTAKAAPGLLPATGGAFQPTPLLIGAAALAAIFLLKPQKAK